MATITDTHNGLKTAAHRWQQLPGTFRSDPSVSVCVSVCLGYTHIMKSVGKVKGEHCH